MVKALERSGCRIIHRSPAHQAPFRITFETVAGERLGIIAYAFLANTKLTKNRPDDEHRFQVKYGPDDGAMHELWQDPYGLYTTLFLGINPELGFFVGADPVLHNPTRFFISVEFKQEHVDTVIRNGWHAWERDRRSRGSESEPAEVLVGGSADNFLRYIRFEQEALGEDQGHRQFLADQVSTRPLNVLPPSTSVLVPSAARLHDLAREFEMSETEVLDLIMSARRLKMAVRGWVAETHLVRRLAVVPGVTDCTRSDEEGGPDVLLRFEGSRPISVECKNVLRERSAAGLVRVDFQRTRASKADPCSRYYSPRDFDVVAACLHAVTERWEFRFARTVSLDPHGKCSGKLSHLVKLDGRWSDSVQHVFRAVANG
ncbi:hypothetical protein [Chondromyces apiculatus]|uniref:hypothetical protein n=1 Tax=Chondromyces apiculatus TaxID=51 RepID=UPI0012DC4473|nr:hypothetical protein [Chondromyces apiculatus]